MSTRRLIAWAAVFTAGGLAVLGFLLFVVGVVIEFLVIRQRPFTDEVSSAMQVALAGLCLSALMMLCGFVLVGVLLAVQTRRQAPGYGEAYQMIQRMQFSQAIPLLEQAVLRGRETPDVLMLLTTAYANTGQFAKAQATADRTVQLFPHDPNSYITLANGYRQQASYEEAAIALQRSVELAPEQPFILAEQGFLYLLAGSKARAIDVFKRAAQQPLPDMYSVRVYYHLTNAYREEGDIEKADAAEAHMVQSQSGIEAWQAVLTSLRSTSYGVSLRYEIEAIMNAIARATQPQDKL